MYRFKNNSKKAIALIVAATLVLSLFSGSLFISTAASVELNDSLSYSFESPGVVNDCDLMNNLSSLKLPAEIIDTPQAAYSNGTTTGALTISSPANLINYNLSQGTDASGRYFYTLKDGAAYTDKSLDSVKNWNNGAYTQLIIPFKTPIKLKHIVVAGMHRNANWRTGEYEIYASSARGELFLPENIVYRRDNTTDKNQVELYSFKDGKELRNISYIALRIYKPHASVDLSGNSIDSAIRPRLFEFNAYGTPENPNYNLSPDYTVNDNTSSINLSNTVVTKSTNFTYTIDGVTNTLSSAYGNQITDYNLTKGSWFSGAYKVFFDPAEGYDYDATTIDGIGTRHINGFNKNTGKEQYVTIETELLSEVDIEDILVANHTQTHLMTGVYEIFASANKADLYKNSVILFDNTNVKKQIQDIHFPSGKELKGIKYVAMRVYSPITDWYGASAKGLYALPDQRIKAIYPRIMEFNVYGKWSNPNFDPDATKLLFNTDSIDKTKTINWVKSTFQLTDEEGTITSLMDNSAKIYDYDYSTSGYVLTRAKPFYTIKDGKDATSNDINDIEKIHNDGSRYFTMILEAETGMTISDFVMVNHTNGALRTRNYEIFASNKMETLFNTESSVLKFDNASNEQTQNLHFSQGKELTDIKFIALRIYDPIHSWTSNDIKNFVKSTKINQIYPRIMEFNAYGVYTDPNYQPPAFSVLGSMDKVDTTQTLAKTLSAKFTIDGSTQKITWTGNEKINDSNIATGSEFHYTGGTKFWDPKDGYNLTSTDANGIGEIYTDGSRYLDLTYKLPTKTRVQDIVVGQNSNAQLQLGKYQIYASAELDTLYTNENLIGEYDAAVSKYQIQNFHWEKGKGITGIKFVGMRLLDPFADWDKAKGLIASLGLKTMFPRIMEFNVYGEYEDPNYIPEEYTDTANYDLSTLFPTYGPNLVKDVNPSFFAEGKRAAVRPATVSNVRNKVSELPSNETVHFDFSDPAVTNKEYFDIQWKLQDYNKLEQYKVNGFAYQGIWRNMPDYYATHYQIYVAADAEDLFRPENMAFEYKAEDMGLMKGIVYEFPASEAPVGGYIGLRVIEPVNGATVSANPRLSVFYVWGEDPGIVPEPTNLAENMPIDAYFSKNKIEKISESNLTAKEVMNMTDLSDETFAKINTKDSNRENTELIYNLCGDMVLDRIAVDVLNNSSTGFSTLKVYASDTLAGVTLEKSLLWTQKMKGKSGKVELTKAIASNSKYRYVRLVFEGCKDYLQINTINVEGLDNQKNKTRDVTANLDMANVSVENVKIKSGETSPLEFNVAAKEAIFDSVVDTYPVVAHNGTVGEDEYQMTVQLDDLRTINKLKIGFLYGFDEYYADTINIYIAETDDEIYGEHKITKPDFVIKKKDIKNQTYEQYLVPRLARFIKFEFKGFSKIEGTQRSDGQYLLTSLIPDISLKGTKVRGMQPSETDENLISFTDKKTGITASIQRLDINDIFTEVAGLKVTPEKATNWQMLSLKNNPYLKVIDKTNYKIEFVDIYGNVVKDLKGRDVVITFNVPKGQNPAEFMVGEATLRTKMVSLETTAINNTVQGYMLWNRDADNKASLLQMVNDDDKYWDTIGELEDFSEGTEEDLKGDQQEIVHDAEWYKTIRTEDGRFEVTGIDEEILENVKFTAEDISDTAPDYVYDIISQISGGKQPVVVYNLGFTLDGEEYKHNGYVNIKMNMPDFIKNNYTDLQVIHFISDTEIGAPWCETVGDTFSFETDSFSTFAIIGTATSEFIDIDGDGNPDYNNIGGSPSTGESPITLPLLGCLVAFAYVVMHTTKCKVRK